MDTTLATTAEAAAPVGTCGSCGRPPQPGFAVLLCASCRTAMAARPFPRWIHGASVFVAGVVLIAVVRFPAALSGAIAFERGQRAEARGSFDVALAEYSKAADRFPDSTLVIARKGLAAYHSRQYAIAAEAFDKIAGQNASEGLAREVNGAILEMRRESSAKR